MYKKNIFKVISLSPQDIWSLEEVKNYLRIEADYDNELITSLTKAAIIAAENFTNLTLLAREIELISNIQYQQHYQQHFALKYPPLISVEKVLLKTEPGELILDDTQYYVDLNKQALFLHTEVRYKELRVNYIAGFNKSNIPPAIKHGILMHIAEMYDRESTASIAMSQEIKNLYLPYRQFRL